MKKTKIIFVVVFMVVIYAVFGGPDNEGKPRHNQEPEKTATGEGRSAGREGPLVWPPATTELVQLAANPLADNYLLMLDTSGSMSEAVCGGGERKIKAAKRAVISFFDRLDPAANVGLYTFSETITEVLPVGRHAPADFAKAVNYLSAGGGTPLTEALDVSEAVLRKVAQGQGGYGSYNLIIVTDGQSTDGDPSSEARKIAQMTAVSINAVGFCTGERHSLNIQGFTNFSTAQNAEQLVESLSQSVQPEQTLYDVSDFDPR